MKIAVYVDPDGVVIPYDKSGTIILYEKRDGQWRCRNKIPLSADNGQSIADVRARVQYIISEIDESKVFVVEKMKSLQISVFDGFGVTVWEHKGKPEVAFDFITEKELEKGQKKPKGCCDTQRSESTDGLIDGSNCGTSGCDVGCDLTNGSCSGVPSDLQPVLISEGAYKIDLALLLTTYSSLNSKQILIPILHNSSFKTLEIVCEHIPRWFGMELESLHLQYHEENSTDGFCHVIVSPKE